MWCSQCQLEHSGNKCPLVAASSVEAIEGYQHHFERKFWEQAYCAAFVDPAAIPSISADRAIEHWRERWGKK